MAPEQVDLGLIGCGRTANRRLVAGKLGRLPTHVRIAAGDIRIGSRILPQLVLQLGGSGRDIGNRRLDTVVDPVPVTVHPLVFFPVNELVGLVHFSLLVSEKCDLCAVTTASSSPHRHQSWLDGEKGI